MFPNDLEKLFKRSTIPKTYRESINTFVEEIVDTNQNNIQAILLYGGLVRDAASIEGWSDIDLIIIYKNIMNRYAQSTAKIVIRNCGVTNQTLLDAFVIFAISGCVLVFYFIFSTIKREITKRKLIIHQIEAPITFSPGGSGERITDFQNLRASAKESIIVMGVGMTYFSSDLSLLDKLLERQLNVRLLMMNPNVIGPESTDEESEFICNMKSNFHISNDYFDEFFSRKNYFTDIHSSYERLVNFIEQRIPDSARKGKVELRTYHHIYNV